MNAIKTKTQTSIQKKGSGLIFAVVLLFVILGMVITLASVTMLETKMNQKTKSSVGAFYNADSGVEWALNKISISSGTISSTLSANPDGSVTCPISPDCKVYFLKSDGTVITQANFSTLTFNDIKAVRSVGSQGTGGAADTQRAIEAAVASGGNACFTYYCGGDGAEQNCTDNGGTRKYCPVGFNQLYAMGHWGACFYDYAYGSGVSHFRPAGGGCVPSYAVNRRSVDIGQAYVCCQ